MIALVFVLLLFGIIDSGRCATFRFASSYGDHMVLQKSPQKAKVWGYASSAAETVTVQVSGKGSVSTQTKHDSSGVFIWEVLLPAVHAGGPYTITASSREGKITLHDVLFGDLWICSGQSNMQFTVSMAFNASAEIASANHYPNIRVLTVAQKMSTKPLLDFISFNEKWSVSSSSSIGGWNWGYFSALCFMYGKHLYDTLKYPIGLVDTSYGGTIDEAWSSPDALDKCYAKNEIPAKKDGDANSFSVLWNAMAKPLLKMTIYERFGTKLAGYRNSDAFTYWPLLRWHQTADYGYVPNDKLKKVFMAVAMDLPDFSSPWGSIHPRDKEDIAQRLFTEALVVAYNQQDKASLRGPCPTGFTVLVGGKDDVIINYDPNSNPIEKRNNDGFEVCCLPRNDIPDPWTHCSYNRPAAEWKAAQITTSTAHSVTLHYGNLCTHSNHYLGGVRYAWKESPCQVEQCAIYNKQSGYPAPPFIHFVTV